MLEALLPFLHRAYQQKEVAMLSLNQDCNQSVRYMNHATCDGNSQ